MLNRLEQFNSPSGAMLELSEPHYQTQRIHLKSYNYLRQVIYLFTVVPQTRVDREKVCVSLCVSVAKNNICRKFLDLELSL